MKKSIRYSEIIKYWSQNQENKGEQICASLEELRKGYDQAQGQYIHPELIHFVAEYVSIEYSFKVKHVMDSINKLGHAMNQTFEESKDQLIAQMQLTSDAQRAKILAQQAAIAARDATIDDQEATIEAQDDHIAATSVPIINCDKILTIFAFGNGYKLSADSTHPQRHFLKRFTFPASMNFTQVFKRVFGTYSFEDFENYDENILLIRALDPKSETDGDQVPPVAE
jgi:hypothetical protein